jgi:hypothetical protein
VESAAVVCARASWQRASRRSVFAWGLGGRTGVDGGLDLDLDLDLAGERGVLELVVVAEAEAEAEAGVGVGVVWRVLASWQSASAGRKRLMAM